MKHKAGMAKFVAKSMNAQPQRTQTIIPDGDARIRFLEQELEVHKTNEKRLARENGILMDKCEELGEVLQKHGIDCIK